MPNQSGKILILGILLLAVVAFAYFFLSPTKPQSSPMQEPNASVASFPISQTDDKSVKCQQDPEENEKLEGEIWSLLPDKIKNVTYSKGKVSPGESTYEIYLLKWSQDCKYLAFLIELEGRDGGAYKKEDYINRGIYIFDSENRNIVTAMLFPEDLYLDKNEYESNTWMQSKYEFVLSESIKEGEFVKKRYSYDIKEKSLSKSVEVN